MRQRLPEDTPLIFLVPLGIRACIDSGAMPNLLRAAAVCLLALSSLPVACLAQISGVPVVNLTGGVAATPPMGWNSWDSYGLTITEAQFRANVDVLRDKLKPFGWQYAVIDEGWFLQNPQDRGTPDKLIYALDANGRYVPVPARFPSAIHKQPRAMAATAAQPRTVGGAMLPATIEDSGFAALGDWVHAQGLKFGIHIVRGIPRASVDRNLPVAGSAFHATDAADKTDVCPWDPTNWGVADNAAGQAWYDSLLQQYAAWGVDFLKVDCIADHPYKVSEIRQIRRAIDKTGRPMVLSLSPGPTQLAHAEEVGTLANMWRISDDFWDRWSPLPAQTTDFPQSIVRQFPRLAAWEPYAKPGNWPDADMLPLGELKPSPGDGQPRSTRLNPAEQRTLVTLWSIARSPLILGANLTMLDPPTLALLTNRDVLRVNQTAVRSAEVVHNGDLLAWRADLPGGDKAIAIFNLGEHELTPTVQLPSFGTDLANRDWSVREVWTGGAAISGHEFLERIPAHGCVMLLLQ